MPWCQREVAQRQKCVVYAMIIMCIAQLSAGNSTIMDSSAGAAALDTSLISLQPVGKWSRCFSNGRMDLIFEVRTVTEGGSKLFTGLTLPGTAAKCSASKPSQCKTLVACEAATSCQKFFPGELSGREKCLVILNTSEDEQEVAVKVELQSPGNWGVIIFGVAASSCCLLAVMALGCYADVSALLAKSKSKQTPAVRRHSKSVSGITIAVGAQQAGSNLHHH